MNELEQREPEAYNLCHLWPLTLHASPDDLLSAGHSCPIATPQAGLRPQRLFPVRWHSLAPEHSITPTAYGVKGKFPLCFQDCWWSACFSWLHLSLSFPRIPHSSFQPYSAPLPSLCQGCVCTLEWGLSPSNYLSNPITPGGPVQMLHPLWATSLSHNTGLTSGLTSTVELPLWDEKLETKRKRSNSPTDLSEVTEWGFSETSDGGGIFGQRLDPTQGWPAALSCSRPCPDLGGVQATPAVDMKYTFCTFSEALHALRTHSAFPEPCTTFHFPYQSWEQVEVQIMAAWFPLIVRDLDWLFALQTAATGFPAGGCGPRFL